jgi:leucyl-tRNA synthetase
MDPKDLDEQFFDYVFLNKKPEDPSKISENWKNAKTEFEYWYPLDSRHSALDLVHNHLTFLIYNHVAIFPQKYWPKQIVGNGFVTMDGAKMSKSMGNILPLRKAISQYGPDVIRFIVTSTAELEKESDFNRPAAEGVISRIKELYSMLDSLDSDGNELDDAGKWFYSRLHEKIKNAKEQYKNLELRSLAQAILYDSINDINWYKQRSSNIQLREFFEYWTLLASPFMPHIAEEFWSKLGKKQFVENSDSVILCKFPQADESKIDSRLDTQEDYLRSVIQDISSIQKLIKKEKLESITLIIHAPFKEKIRALVAEHKNMPIIMQKAKEDKELANDMKSVSKYAARYLKTINKMIGDSLDSCAEYSILISAKEFLEKEFNGAQIEILHEKDATGELVKKADFAAPNKPSIVIK